MLCVVFAYYFLALDFLMLVVLQKLECCFGVVLLFSCFRT